MERKKARKGGREERRGERDRGRERGQEGREGAVSPNACYFMCGVQLN